MSLELGIDRNYGDFDGHVDLSAPHFSSFQETLEPVGRHNQTIPQGVVSHYSRPPHIDEAPSFMTAECCHG